MAEKNEGSVAHVVGGIIGLALMGYFFFGGGLEKQAAKDMKKIEDQVAADAVKQYEIARRNGTTMDVCVAAGMVTAAYLQAKDEPNYATWKSTQSADCAEAGLPNM